MYHGHGRMDFLKVYLMAAHRYVLVLPLKKGKVSRSKGAFSQFVNGLLRRQRLLQTQAYHLPREAVLHWYGIEVEGVGGLWRLGRVVPVKVPLVYVCPSGKADRGIIDCEVGRCGEAIVDLGIGIDWDGRCDVHNWLGGSGWILGLQQSLDLFYSPSSRQSPRDSQVEE